MTRTALVLPLAAAVWMAAAAPLPAASTVGSKNDALGGDLLLEGLDDLIANPVPPVEEPKQAAPRREGPSWLPNRKELEKRMKESLDGKPLDDQLGEDLRESPLVAVRSSMDRAGQLIATGDDGAETRPTQEQVIDQLDELIKKMEKQCQNCNNPGASQGQQQSKRSKPSQPKESQQAKQGDPKKSKPSGSPKSQNAANQSSMRLGQAEAAAAEAQRRAEVIKRVWGRLPERLREQMLQSTSDEFLPEYRDEIEQYFERLAEEPSEN